MAEKRYLAFYRFSRESSAHKVIGIIEKHPECGWSGCITETVALSARDVSDAVQGKLLVVDGDTIAADGGTDMSDKQDVMRAILTSWDDAEQQKLYELLFAAGRRIH